MKTNSSNLIQQRSRRF